MAKPVLQALPAAIDLVGRLSLPEIAAFLSRVNLFVGNDSGLMHLCWHKGHADSRPVRADQHAGGIRTYLTVVVL